MNHETNDPLIDALLEEVMGGQSPPDLSSMILAQLDPESDSYDEGMTTTHGTSISIKRRHTSRRQSFIVPLSMALSIAAFVLATIAIVLNTPQNDQHGGTIAENSDSGNSVPDNTVNPSVPSPNIPKDPTQNPSPSQPFETPKPAVVADGDLPSNSPDPIQSIQQPLPPLPDHWQHPQALAASSTSVASAETPEILTQIKRELDKQWKENGITPSEPATSLEWVRRVYLRLIGRVPTKVELDRFGTVALSDEQRSNIVDTLLYGDQYKTAFTQHWTTIWTNTLIGRQGGLDSDHAHREGLQQYLRESLSANKPYDQMVYELIAAEGAATDTSEDFNGAVNFLLASLTKNDTTLATSRISSIFLGQKLQCAQCHHHPTSDIAQGHFWELDAFLSQLTTTNVDGEFILTDTTTGGIRTADGRTGVYYERPDGVARIAFPSFLGHTPTEPNHSSSTSNRRTQLARLTSQSPLLARTLVNRMWDHFLGYGFTISVDDMGPHLPVSHPQLLEMLSQQTESANYDLKQIMKWLVLSDPFSRSSKYSASNDMDSPELGDQPLFSRYYSRQLEPEEVYQSLLVLTGKQPSVTTIGQQQLAQRTWLGQFSKPMETDDADESNSFNGDVHQSLVLMNGELMKEATAVTDTTVLGKVLRSNMPNENKIEHLFLAAVARNPSASEKKLIAELIAMPGSSSEQVFQDIWWALLNSNEFILDH